MKHYCNTIRLVLPMFFVACFIIKASGQNKPLSGKKAIDSLVSKGNYEAANTVLLTDIEFLKQNESYFELTKYIYYYGRIKLKLEGKTTAVQNTKDFANSITKATDSLKVSRQKHLVLSRFYVFISDYKMAENENLLALAVTKNIPSATGDLFGLIHHNLSIDNRRLGNIKKAIWHSRKSLEHYLSYPKSDKTKLLEAYNSLGSRMWDVYKIDSALYYFKEGEKITTKLPQTPMNKYYHAAKIQANISSVYSLLGKTDSSFTYSEKAIKNYSNYIDATAGTDDFFREEARLFLAITIENYADDYSKLGNYNKAKDLLEYCYDQKQKYMPEDLGEIAYISLQLGNIYLKLKDYKKAEELIDKGLNLYEQATNKNYLGIADANYYKGIIAEVNDDIDNAKVYYEKSKALYESIYGGSYDDFYLNAMLTYSEFYSKNGYTQQALEMATKAFEYVKLNQGKKTLLEYSQLVNLANIHYNAGNYKKAATRIDSALDLLATSFSSKSNQINAFNVSFKKPMALLLKSKIALKLKKNRDSLFLKNQYSKLKEAIGILEKQKTLITEDESVSIILEDNDEIFELSKELALMLYEETKDPKYLKEVLSLHESKLYNKIRQQLNLQSDFVTKDIPNSILEKEKQSKLQIKTALNSENGLNTFITANKNWKNFIQTLKQDYPKYYQLRYASISESINFEDNLFSNEKTLIRYVYVNDKLYAFVIDNNKIQVHKLDAVALQNTLKNQENKTLTSNSFEQNHNLYNLLWKPFENSITKKSVVVVPDKDLFNLSFETFAVNKVNSLKKLVEKSLLNTYCISYNYSLLLINKNRTPKFFEKNFISFTPEFNDEMKTNYKIAINDSAFLDKTYLTLLPQPFATDLAKQYANLFNGESYLNENASKQVFQNKAKEHKIIHIGTHAESNNVTPQLSRLIFAKNINGTMASEDNSLYTYEIYNQNLSSNLAILTACETGKPTYQSGEGMISLAHAFNYAGSESILTSLWKIDEQSSALIIESFYKHLKKGLPKDKALQKAKLEYLSAAQGRTLNPQYWAGLVLIGDTSPIELSSDSDLVFWILALLVLIVITAIVIKRKRAA